VLGGRVITVFGKCEIGAGYLRKYYPL